ncbi:hypothetical protein GCM10027347_32210 [Larkinella harenae]
MKELKYIANYYFKRSRFWGQVSLPENVNFPVTDNCNSQCVMCDVWKESSENDMSISEIEQLFSSKLFSKVKHIGLSGGEPTLRKDLVEIVEILKQQLHKLQTLSITTHGYHSDRWAQFLPKILEILDKKNIHFTLNVSIDGKRDIHNLNRGISTAYDKATETIKIAKALGINVQVQHTVTPLNFNYLNSSFKTLSNLSNNFIVRRSVEVARLDNKETINKLGSYERLDSVMSDFLSYSDLKQSTLNPARRLFYKDLANRLANNTERKAPCYYKNEGIVVSASGDLFHCSISYQSIGNGLKVDPIDLYFSKTSMDIREKIIETQCPICLHDQSGAWSPFALFWETFNSKFPSFVKNYKKISKLLQVFNSYVKSEFKILFDKKKTFENISPELGVIVGAYGGEHVGDSAILGGVILRTKEKYGTKNFVVLSSRPDRTKIWIKGLKFSSDINISVVHREKYNIVSKHSLFHKSAVIYGGGPIMELFEDMMFNLKIINYFIKNKLPFFIEGCGFGPFNSKLGRYLGKEFFRKADQITLRQNVKIDKPYILKVDPAFDYLFANKPLQKVIPNELVNFTSKYEKIVILNLRPLWSKYAKGANLKSLHDNVIAALSMLIKSNSNIGFLYIPFNFDHYGFSDVNPALDILDKVESAENYCIVEKELTFKEIINYITLAESAICMRFHACIFASALGLKTMGIDYSGSGKGKVNGLYEMGLINASLNLNNINIDILNNFVSSADVSTVGIS